MSIISLFYNRYIPHTEEFVKANDFKEIFETTGLMLLLLVLIRYGENLWLVEKGDCHNLC